VATQPVRRCLDLLLLFVVLCLVLMYLWPGMTLWLPEFLYSR